MDQKNPKKQKKKEKKWSNYKNNISEIWGVTMQLIADNSQQSQSIVS